MGRGVVVARPGNIGTLSRRRVGGTSDFYSNCGGFLSGSPIRHRTIHCAIRLTGGTNFTRCRRSGRCGTNSELCCMGHSGTITLTMVNGGNIGGNTELTVTRVSSPEISLGPGPLFRTGGLTFFGARCCNNLGGCR